MVKYIQVIIDDLNDRIAGMKANPEKWTNQPVTVAELEADVASLEAQAAKIAAAEGALQKEREAGRKLVETFDQKVKQVDNLTFGIHATETTKLVDYKLSLRKSNSSKPIPSKGMMISIVDDVDGEGFVVTWGVIAGADHYEIERGIAPNITDLVLSPPYSFLKTTTKTVLNDDDVLKGKRYFYRIRAVNAAGTGEWSEPVNRVQ
jgi:hypothetical protein